MLEKNFSQIEAALETCINLKNFYTFDNSWKFYGFEKITENEDIKFEVDDNTFQSHILNYIAILKDVTEYQNKLLVG